MKGAQTIFLSKDELLKLIINNSDIYSVLLLEGSIIWNVCRRLKYFIKDKTWTFCFNVIFELILN